MDKSSLNPCQLVVQEIEQKQKLSRMLLSTISLVETGKWIRATRKNVAWPWTINSRSQSRYYQTKASAVAAVRRLQANGLRSIDVGYMQINFHHHSDAFASLEDAFDPRSNISYAADFLKSLRKKVRS